MKNVLIDNWTIEKIMANFNERNVDRTEEMSQLIYAMTLWDDVYYLENEHSTWWNHVVDNTSELSFLKRLKKVETSPEFAQELANNKYMREYSSQYTGVVAKRALEYMYYAESFGMNYLPSGKRASFINDNDLYQNIERIEFINEVNELAYFNEVNKNLKEADINFIPDCLLNVIYNDGNTSIETIISNIDSMRKDPQLRIFKSWVNKVEKHIEEGRNIQSITREFAKELNENKDYNLWENVAKLGINVGMCAITVKLEIPMPIAPLQVKFVKPHLLFPINLYRKNKK